MVAELNGTQPATRFYSDAEMREAVSAYQLRHTLDDATMSNRIGVSLVAFQRWMEGSPALTVARARLIRFCREKQLIADHITQDEREATTRRSAIAYMADCNGAQPGADEKLAEAGDVLLGAVFAEAAAALADAANSLEWTQPESPEPIEGVFVDTPTDIATAIILHSPFPTGFALVWTAPPVADPAIRISDGGVLLNRSLRKLMGEPDRVLVAIQTDSAWTVGRIALSAAVPDALTTCAVRVPKSGELSKGVRIQLGAGTVPNGTYPVSSDGDCWITGEIALNVADLKRELA